MYTILHLETSTLYKTLIKEISAELSSIYINAASVDEAFDILGKSEVSLILTPMEVEGGNTADFIKALNDSEYKKIPVVVFTGNDSLEDRKRMYDLGIVDYILKTSGREIIKNNLAVFRKDDPVASKMKALKYAVLDDNKMDRKIIGRIFSMHQVVNVDYYDSEESLLGSGKDYDVYIIDLVLKNITGDKVIMKLREQKRGSVVIAVSGIDNVKTISRVLSIGADDYITKPFNYEIFIARLKTNIRNYLLMREVRRKTKLLEKMSVTDPLTQLFNRRHVYERLSQEAEKWERYKSPFSVLMLDIDNFKILNDTCGHQYGDEILQQVSQVIVSTVRNVDIAGRFGGEEFLVIFPEIRIDGAAVVAERIRAAISEIDTCGKSDPITVSGGVAEYTGGDFELLIKKADELLYAAKEKGRNMICSR
jgi:two-component system cell cycle response regulator